MNETTPENQQPSDIGNLDQVINESKQKLAEEAQVTVKSRRGRPRKSPDSATSTASARGSTAPATALAPAMDYTPMLGNVIAIPFVAASRKTGWDGWLLDEVEKQSHAVALNQVCNDWIPSIVNSRYGSLLMFTFGISSSVVMKYLMYSEHLAEKKKEEAIKASARPDLSNPFEQLSPQVVH